MVPVVPSAGTVYGTLNVTLSGYDMTVVKCFSQYIHHMCNRLNIKVEEWWGGSVQKYYDKFKWVPFLTEV